MNGPPSQDDNEVRPVIAEPRSDDGLTTRQAAARLGVHERTIRRAIARGDLSARKHRSAYRITAAALERYARPPPVAPLIVLPTPEAGMTSLPASLSPFIGRQDDLAAVAALLLEPAVRLLTLTGPGGIGKTRLAIEAAATVRASFPDGVVFVSLAPISREELVVSAVADALGPRAVGRHDPRSHIRGLLRSRRLLLVLDNFEHVLGAAPLVAELLAEAPAATALVTSRAPLHLTGERELLVPPLTLPRSGTAITEKVLMASDAGRLFIERTRAHDPSFAVDDATAPALAEICARLDGLPLAIELAAARTKLLPPPALLQRLASGLPFLTAGPRDAPQRQRTLRQTIAWSYDLLSPEEQALFRRLAVFAGGFTLEAASPLSPHHPITLSPSPDTHDLLSSLLDQSLLVRERGLDDRFRFRMLETIREYGLERLAAAGEQRPARAAHALYFLRLAQSLYVPTLVGATDEPRDHLAMEDANLHGALSWLADAGPAADFVRLAAALQGYWCAVSHYREGQEWLERALARTDAGALVDRARVLAGLGRLALLQGDQAAAESRFATALPLLREAATPLETSATLVWCGALANQAGDYAAAEPLLEEALALVSADEEHAAIAATANALANLGVTARGRGAFSAAAVWHEAALARYQQHGHELGETRSRADLGDLARDQGNYPLAVTHYRAALASIGERGDMRVVADALAGIASAAAAWGEARPAARLFGAAEALRARVGTGLLVPADHAAEQRGVAAIRQTLGDDHLATLWAEGRAFSRADADAEALLVGEALGSAAAPRQPGDRVMLSSRELEVLRLLVAQRTDQEIADALFLSRRTVSWYVAGILDKLGVASRRQAAAVAVADGLV